MRHLSLPHRPPLAEVPPRPADSSVPAGLGIRLGSRVRLWAGGQALIGGAPWRISRLSPPVVDLVRRLHAAGAAGVRIWSPVERAAARVLLDRGFAEVPAQQVHGVDPVADLGLAVVIPVYRDAEGLRGLLACLRAQSDGDRLAVVVVDDASPDPVPIAAAAAAHGARLIRHASNQGPAAARNTGLHATDEPLIAFIDADCLVPDRWPAALTHHFLDPAVAAVAPRVLPTEDAIGMCARYQATSSALDMGRVPELVRPGARLGFVPSAALVMRRSAIAPAGFDPDLRLGEDVDLVWRLADAGWLVRYDPDVIVRHHGRPAAAARLRRIYQYGTSAAELDERHPGRLAPARLSPQHLATLALMSVGYPAASLVPMLDSYVRLARQLHGVPDAHLLAARTLALGLLADSQSIGRGLRREWWPLGAVALATSPRSRLAQAAAASMIVPLLAEWLDTRPALDPVRFTALRMLDDAAYGTGVLRSCLVQRRWRALLPAIGTARGGGAGGLIVSPCRSRRVMT